MFKKGMLRFLASFTCLTLLLPFLSNLSEAFAATLKQTNINIEVSATDIDITVPLNFACTINPNIEDGFMSASNLTVENNSNAPILLSVNGFVDNSTTFENNILPNGLPDGKDWKKLSVKESKKYFSLGLKGAIPGEWDLCLCEDYIYAKTINEAGVNTHLGVINPFGVTSFDLDAHYGRAFKEAFTFSYQLNWVAELYEGEIGVVDNENTTVFNYEVISEPSTQTASNFNLFNPVVVVHADSNDEYGTARITGVKNNFNLSNVVIPSYYIKDGVRYKVIEIGNDAFSSTSNNVVENITTITIPSTITSIGRAAFNGCNGLTSITIPENITNIEPYAFANCNNLNTISFKHSSKSILLGEYCFYNIADNAILYVSNTNLFTYLNDATFVNNSSSIVNTNTQKEIINTFKAGNSITATLYTLQNETYLDFEGTGLMTDYPNAPEYIELLNSYDDIIVNIGDGITRIGDNSFKGCYSIYKVNIPSSVITIGNSAFYSCGNLMKINIEEGLVNMGTSCFASCNFEYFRIPNSVTNLGDRVFENCQQLKALVFPPNLTSIGVSAINTCRNLRYVDVLGNIEHYGNWIFYDSGVDTQNGLKVYVNNEALKNSWDSMRETNFISPNGEIIVRENNDFYYEYADKGLWSWDKELVSGDYSELLDWCVANNITDLYQVFKEEDLKNNKDVVGNFIIAFKNEGIKVWFLAGSASWCTDYLDCLEALTAINIYNNGKSLEDISRLENIMLDNEVHTLPDYSINEDEINAKFIESCKNIYLYCERINLKVGHTFGGALIEDHLDLLPIYENYCDKVTFMNYWTTGYVSQCAKELEVCSKYSIPCETIASFGLIDTACEWFTLEGAINSWKEISNEYKNPILSYSYHWYGSVKDLEN